MKILIELSKESSEIYDFAQLLVKDFPYSIKQATVIPDSEIVTPEQEEAKVDEMYLNMQYYMEYCQLTGYVTPQDWIEKHKHF